jgi:hypothetical protein
MEVRDTSSWPLIIPGYQGSSQHHYKGLYTTPRPRLLPLLTGRDSAFECHPVRGGTCPIENDPR